MTREADLVQLVQEGQPGGGRGASQPRGLTPRDRSWPTMLDGTGCQHQPQNGRDERGAGFACLLTAERAHPPDPREADVLPPDPTENCGARCVCLERIPPLGGWREALPFFLFLSESREGGPVRWGILGRNPFLSAPLLKTRKKLWPGFSCPGGCRSYLNRPRSKLLWLGPWCQEAGFSLGELGLRGGVRGACSLVLLAQDWFLLLLRGLDLT